MAKATLSARYADIHLACRRRRVRFAVGTVNAKKAAPRRGAAFLELMAGLEPATC